MAEGLPVSQAASEDFLVTAVQQALRIGLDITEKDIFLAPDPEYFPPDAGDICIGIKDGNTDREEDISECLDLTEEIHLCLHVRLPRGETDLSFLITEILSLEKKIHKILDQNTFELPGYTDAFCDGGKASKTADRHSARQTKAIIYKYTKEQKRESSE
ncbi:MAG: hypothetical protein GY749_02060 [Desulfobacteraceae bacterium]|nr:hypothetical protein [Desulfobacteraceae bacterium]